MHHFLYTIILGHVDQNEWSGSSINIFHSEILR